MRLRNYKHIIWDWNGTLMDDAWLCVEVMNGILQRYGKKPVSLEVYRHHFTFPVVRYYEWLGFCNDQISFEKVSHEFIHAYNQRRFECQLHPETTELLQQIQSLDIDQVILSAYTHHTLVEIIHHYGLDPYFRKLIGLDNIYAASKVALGQAHFATLDHDPHEVLLIGDTLHDFEVAQSLGVDCVLLSHGHHDHSRLAATGKPVFESLSALRQYLTT